MFLAALVGGGTWFHHQQEQQRERSHVVAEQKVEIERDVKDLIERWTIEEIEQVAKEAAERRRKAAGTAGEGEMTPEQRTAEEQNLAAKVRISILNVAPDGTVKVGFTDLSVNPPENYYLKVGGSQNGWTVKSAELAAESVTLEKDGIEVTMKLGEGSGGKGGSKEAAKGGVARRAFTPPGGNRDDSGAGGPPPPPPARFGGLARLRQHRMEMEAKQREEAERKREADAAVKAEQAEREAREQEEKQRLAEERAQQREALLQIQKQLRK